MLWYFISLLLFSLLSFRKFEELSAAGEKVGEPSKALAEQLAAMQADEEDTSCGYAEEGQDPSDHKEEKKETSALV